MNNDYTLDMYDRVDLRYTVRSVGLDRDLERDLIVFHKASLWVGYVLRSTNAYLGKKGGSISQVPSRRRKLANLGGLIMTTTTYAP